MKKLTLSKDLSLPIEAVTQTFGILAVRGAGKSNLAAVIAEEMFGAGLPFVVVDPVGSWFGLRAGADGKKGGGLAVPIFGGRHGDLPLHRHSGEQLADLVASRRLSCVLDLSAFESEGAKKAFLLDFARRLYQKNTDPLHLFLEEADDYIPQRPMRDEAQLLRAWENIVRRGRSRGIGITLITQRSAAINKTVLTQVETLFVLRTTGPQDRAAIEAWVKYHQTGSEVLESLAGLKTGEAWVWSPHFLGVMARVQVRQRRTFDSGATPKNLRGADARPVATLADVDLAALGQELAASVAEAKADDPKELKKQLAETRAALAKVSRTGSAAADRAKAGANYSETIPKVVEKKVIGPKEARRIEAAVVNLERIATVFADLVDRAAAVGQKGRDLMADVQTTAADVRAMLAPAPQTTVHSPKLAAPPAPTPRAPRPPAGPPADGVSPVGQRILNALAELAQLGARQPAREMVAFLAGYSHLQSKGFVNGIGALRSAGLVEYPAGGAIALTDAGRAAAQPPPAPSSAGEVQARIIQLLGGASARILEPLIEVYPSAMIREDLAARAGYGHLQSKGFVNAIGRLRTLGFIDYPDRGTVKAQPVLFLES